MYCFNLDEEIQNVKYEKTKNYLHEIASTYYNGNYRSSIVILYSVVIYDFIKKLQILRDIYQDNAALEYLNDFENKQMNNPKYSDLEKIIINAVIEKKMLNQIEMDQFYQLKTARDYCAHPVFVTDYELINPTKEQTLAHIRNMFEAVFLKDAILNNKIYDNFLNDLSEFFSRSDIIGLEQYLDARYYSKINDTTMVYLFKNLWCLSFNIIDNDCNKNRKALCHALIYLVKKDQKMYLKYFKENANYLSNRICVDKIDVKFDDKSFSFYNHPLLSLIYFLSLYPQFYPLISQDIRIEINNACCKNANVLLLASYISTNMESHVELIISHISGNDYCIDPITFLEVYKHSKDTNSSSSLRKLAIYYFCNNMNSFSYTPDFEYINNTYNQVISKIIYDFTKEDLEYLLNNFKRSYASANTFQDLCADIKYLINNGIDINLQEYTFYEYQ